MNRARSTLFATHLRVAVLVFVVAFSSPVLGGEGKKKKATEGDEIFVDASVLRIRIEISPAGVSQLRQTTRPFRASMGIDRDPRPEVPCTVYEGGKVYTNVAAHIKGTGGSFRSIDGNPALSFNFHKHATNQTFHGLKKISLNNSVQDPTFLSEKICREMFVQVGIPVPRAGFATLVLNGRNLGMRVMLEGTDKVFLRKHFKDVSGNLYDSGLIRDFDAQLSVICGDHPENHADLDQLRAAMRLSGKAQMAALEKVLDVDRFYKFFAMEVLLASWDSYSLHQNNYRIYHDMDQDRLMFMPQGMDQMFGVYRATPTLSLYPNLEGMLSSAVIQTPEGRRRYEETLGKLYRSVFDAEKLTRRANDLAAIVRPMMEERVSDTSDYDQSVAQLVSRIRRRSASIHEQLQEMGR